MVYLPRLIVILVLTIIAFAFFARYITITTDNPTVATILAPGRKWIHEFKYPNVSATISILDKMKREIALRSVMTHNKTVKMMTKRNSTRKSLHMFNGTVKVKQSTSKPKIEMIRTTSNVEKQLSIKNNIRETFESREGSSPVSTDFGNSYHPFVSPRKGSDINSDQQIALLKCKNQSQCIVPELQLREKVKVYMCKHPVKGGVRFYFLMREGLLLHPNVLMLEQHDMHLADYVIYLPASAPWHKTECTNVSLASKMIVMDEHDGPTLFHPRKTLQEVIKDYGSKQWYFMYYKRSFVRREDGKFLGFPHFDKSDVYPMVYPIAEAYLPIVFNEQRDTEVLCTLRGSFHGMTTRARVQKWVAEYGKIHNITNMVSKELNMANRPSISRVYFNRMASSKIIVTVNPAAWEGDFRLWEALSSGALIFVDHLYVPHPYPLIDGKHIIYYSNNNKTELYNKLDYYRKHPNIARRIAVNGYLHALKYHRTVNLADYILRSASVKRRNDSYKGDGGSKPGSETGNENENNENGYKYTAQYLLEEVKKHEKVIKKDFIGWKLKGGLKKHVD